MKPIRKIGIFGGTFDPPHSGHLHLARLFCEAVRPDLLLIIPARIPPHKASRQVAAGQQRMKMCALNFASLSPCAVSSLELLREGPSYTADTLAQIAAIWPGAELYFLCGGDMFRTVHAWKRPEEIFARAVLCAAARTEGEQTELAAQAQRLSALGARTVVMRGGVMEVSSTELRQKLAAGEETGSLLQEKVLRYIREEGLYADA